MGAAHPPRPKKLHIGLPLAHPAAALGGAATCCQECNTLKRSSSVRLGGPGSHDIKAALLFGNCLEGRAVVGSKAAPPGSLSPSPPQRKHTHAGCKDPGSLLPACTNTARVAAAAS